MKKLFALLAISIMLLGTFTLFQSHASIPSNAPFSNMVLLMMENTALYQVTSSSAPELSTLLAQGAQSTNTFSETSGSLPNYISISSGLSGLGSCDTTPNNKCGPFNFANIVDRFGSSGITWKGYMEGMPASNICNPSSPGAWSDAGDSSSHWYVGHHNPFVYYPDVYQNTTRCTQVVNAGTSNGGTACSTISTTGLASTILSDLNHANPPNFMWLQPNNLDNYHDCGLGGSSAAANIWLATVVPAILNSTTFTASNSKAILLIVFDEGAGSASTGPIPLVWLGPAAKAAYSSSVLYNHYSVLHTIENAWGLATLTSNDAGAPLMTEFFKTSTSPTFSLSASPLSVATTPGVRGASEITVSESSGFTGGVLLSVTTSGGLSCIENTGIVILSTTLTSGTWVISCSSGTAQVDTANVTGVDESGTIHQNMLVTFNITSAPIGNFISAPWVLNAHAQSCPGGTNCPTITSRGALNTTMANPSTRVYNSTDPYNSNVFIGGEDWCSPQPSCVGNLTFTNINLNGVFTTPAYSGSPHDFTVENSFYFYFTTAQTGTNLNCNSPTHSVTSHWLDVEIFYGGRTGTVGTAGDYIGYASCPDLNMRQIENSTLTGQSFQMNNFNVTKLYQDALSKQGLSPTVTARLSGFEIGVEAYGVNNLSALWYVVSANPSSTFFASPSSYHISCPGGVCPQGARTVINAYIVMFNDQTFNYQTGPAGVSCAALYNGGGNSSIVCPSTVTLYTHQAYFNFTIVAGSVQGTNLFGILVSSGTESLMVVFTFSETCTRNCPNIPIH